MSMSRREGSAAEPAISLNLHCKIRNLDFSLFLPMGDFSPSPQASGRGFFPDRRAGHRHFSGTLPQGGFCSRFTRFSTARTDKSPATILSASSGGLPPGESAPGHARRELAFPDQPGHLVGQLQKPQSIGDGGAGFPHPPGDLILGHGVILHELLVTHASSMGLSPPLEVFRPKPSRPLPGRCIL